MSDEHKIRPQPLRRVVTTAAPDPMKFQPDRITGANVIAGYTPYSVQVGEHTWRESFLLPWKGEARAWAAVRYEALGVAHFETIAALAPELVLFGSGPTLRFPRPEWLRPLVERRIGFESMDTAAACRTYNLLVAEGRAVVAALLLGPGGPDTPPGHAVL